MTSMLIITRCDDGYPPLLFSFLGSVDDGDDDGGGDYDGVDDDDGGDSVGIHGGDDDGDGDGIC